MVEGRRRDIDVEDGVHYMVMEFVAGKGRGTLRRLTSEATSETAPSVTPGGQKLVFRSGGSKSANIWLKDLETGKTSQLIAGSPFTYPKISPDGAAVAFQSRGEMSSIPTGGGSPEVVCTACGRPESWSRDRSLVLFIAQSSGKTAISVLNVKARTITQLVKHPKMDMHAPRLSPDDRWVGFYGKTSATARTIYVAPFRGEHEIPEKDWIAVTDGTQLDREPQWSSDGKLLYFFSERDGFRCIWALRLDPATKRPAGSPFAVFHSHDASRSIANTGNNTADAGPAVAKNQLIFAMNEMTGSIWMTKLKLD